MQRSWWGSQGAGLVARGGQRAAGFALRGRKGWFRQVHSTGEGSCLGAAARRSCERHGVSWSLMSFQFLYIGEARKGDV